MGRCQYPFRRRFAALPGFRGGAIHPPESSESSARVLIFPEAVVPRWSAATEAFWRVRSTAAARAARYSLSVRECRLRPNQPTRSEDISDLKLYDFTAAIGALQENGYDAPAYDRDDAKPAQSQRQHDAGCGRGIRYFYQRVPVPVGMWRPWSRDSVPLRPAGPGVLASITSASQC